MGNVKVLLVGDSQIFTAENLNARTNHKSVAFFLFSSAKHPNFPNHIVGKKIPFVQISALSPAAILKILL